MRRLFDFPTRTPKKKSHRHVYCLWIVSYLAPQNILGVHAALVDCNVEPPRLRPELSVTRLVLQSIAHPVSGLSRGYPGATSNAKNRHTGKEFQGIQGL
jgi:hypothetical protein